MQFDFRSVYGSIFKQWFEADDAEVQQVLFDNFESLPILKPDTTSERPVATPKFELYPNPVKDQVMITLEVLEGDCTLQLFTSSGHQTKTPTSKIFGAGLHNFSLDLSYLEPGTYFLGLINGSRRQTIPFLKM